MPDPVIGSCSCCGLSLSPDNLVWDYPWPDELAALPAGERDALLQFRSRVFLVADGYGTAIRVILPVRLDSGHTATLGVWLALLGSQDAERVSSAARTGGDAWIGCTFTGPILNAVAPWPEVYTASATAVASSAGELARVVDSTHDALKRVLADTWPHDQFLRARPPQRIIDP